MCDKNNLSLSEQIKEGLQPGLDILGLILKELKDLNCQLEEVDDMLRQWD